MKESCVICKKETLYDREDHISFRLGYIQGSGQLCLKCFGENYVKKSRDDNRQKSNRRSSKNLRRHAN